MKVLLKVLFVVMLLALSSNSMVLSPKAACVGFFLGGVMLTGILFCWGVPAVLKDNDTPLSRRLNVLMSLEK